MSTSYYFSRTSIRQVRMNRCGLLATCEVLQIVDTKNWVIMHSRHFPAVKSPMAGFTGCRLAKVGLNIAKWTAWILLLKPMMFIGIKKLVTNIPCRIIVRSLNEVFVTQFFNLQGLIILGESDDRIFSICEIDIDPKLSHRRFSWISMIDICLTGKIKIPDIVFAGGFQHRILNV